jgi:hypothetical protein
MLAEHFARQQALQHDDRDLSVYEAMEQVPADRVDADSSNDAVPAGGGSHRDPFSSTQH